MRTKEIESQAWLPFFNDFTKCHQGERVNVETLEKGDVGVRSYMRDLPLIGIVTAGSDDAAKLIEIIAGDSPKTLTTHAVPKPAHVRVAEEDDGKAVALQIESSYGLVTMLRFAHESEGMPSGFMIE